VTIFVGFLVAAVLSRGGLVDRRRDALTTPCPDDIDAVPLHSVANQELLIAAESPAELVKKKCIPCEGGIPRISRSDAEAQLNATARLASHADGQRIRKVWVVRDFLAGIDFFKTLCGSRRSGKPSSGFALEGYRNVVVEYVGAGCRIVCRTQLSQPIAGARSFPVTAAISRFRQRDAQREPTPPVAPATDDQPCSGHCRDRQWP